MPSFQIGPRRQIPAGIPKQAVVLPKKGKGTLAAPLVLWSKCRLTLLHALLKNLYPLLAVPLLLYPRESLEPLLVNICNFSNTRYQMPISIPTLSF